MSKPRHQQAQDWVDQTDEHLYWMVGETRKIFLNAVLEIALEELTTWEIASAFGGIWRIENVLKEAKEVWGDNE